MSFLPSPHELAWFLTAALVLLLIPGPAVLYIVARSVDQGRAAGLASAAGIAIGTLVHVLAACVGLSALLLSSATAFSAVRYAGAAYLFYLGIKKFRERPRTGRSLHHVDLIPLRKVFCPGSYRAGTQSKSGSLLFCLSAAIREPLARTRHSSILRARNDIRSYGLGQRQHVGTCCRLNSA
jgi:hypothetical protein